MWQGGDGDSSHEHLMLTPANARLLCSGLLCFAILLCDLCFAIVVISAFRCRHGHILPESYLRYREVKYTPT